MIYHPRANVAYARCLRTVTIKTPLIGCTYKLQNLFCFALRGLEGYVILGEAQTSHMLK